MNYIFVVFVKNCFHCIQLLLTNEIHLYFELMCLCFFPDQFKTCWTDLGRNWDTNWMQCEPNFGPAGFKWNPNWQSIWEPIGTQLGSNLDRIWFCWKTYNETIQNRASKNVFFVDLSVVFKLFFGCWHSDLSFHWSIQFLFWNIRSRLFAWAQIPTPDSAVVKGLFDGGVEGYQTQNILKTHNKWVHAIPALTTSYDM